MDDVDYNSDAYKQRIGAFIEKIISVAKGDYSVQLELSHKNDDLDALAMGINMMIDELNLNHNIGLEKERIKKLNQQLEEAKKRAEESDRLKSAFLANMSHEIRTPLNGILGFTELLKEPGLNSDRQHEFIGIIEKSGQRLMSIINDIIDISKIESGQMTVSNSTVSVNQCLEDLYLFFKPEAEQKNIELRLIKPLQDHEAIIHTDRNKLNGILTNLLKNALKYTKSGSVEFGYQLKDSKTRIEFCVKDTGIGVPENRQAAIFERFIQADIDDKMARQGAGIGLAIVKAYVEMLKGEIWLESRENVGSTFYFTLPYNCERKPIDAEKKDENQNTVKNLKILIVEDDEISNLHLQILCRTIAKEIIHVRDGLEAVEVCRNNPDTDLVLMDVKIPGISGYEATGQIRAFNKEVIIIAQTAYALSGEREKALAAGCNEYISKPIKDSELRSLIHKFFDENSSRYQGKSEALGMPEPSVAESDGEMQGRKSLHANP